MSAPRPTTLKPLCRVTGFRNAEELVERLRSGGSLQFQLDGDKKVTGVTAVPQDKKRRVEEIVSFDGKKFN